MLLHLYAVLVAVSTAVLIFAGGLVTSTGSGLSVPDWPTTYGWFMFTFPLEKMVGGIRFEHTHRLIASTVGFLILVLAVWLRLAEPRRWVRRLGYVALGAVVTQGILGGITVLWFLPDPISIAHASLAQIVFCLTISIALGDITGLEARIFRSRSRTRRSNPAARRPGDNRPRVSPDPCRRDDAPHRCGTRHPGLSVRLRTADTAGHGTRRLPCTSRIASARSS